MSKAPDRVAGLHANRDPHRRHAFGDVLVRHQPQALREQSGIHVHLHVTGLGHPLPHGVHDASRFQAVRVNQPSDAAPIPTRTTPDDSCITPLDVVPKIDENSDSSGKSIENRSMPLVLSGSKWTAVGWPYLTRLVLRIGVWCWTSSRPRPWGDPPPKRRRLLRGMQKPTWAAPWPSPTPRRAPDSRRRPIQSGRKDRLTRTQVLKLDEVGADIAGLPRHVHADRDRQRIEVHHKVGRSIQINPKPCLLQLAEQLQVDVQPQRSKQRTGFETGAS